MIMMMSMMMIMMMMTTMMSDDIDESARMTVSSLNHTIEASLCE